MRLAVHIASSAWEGLNYVMLAPDGSLWATDTVALLRSLDAHDANLESPLYVEVPRGTKLGDNALSFGLDVAGLTLIERRPRSERVIPIGVKRDIVYPPVARAIPGGMAPVSEHTPAFDSIKAGGLASTYGLKYGVWSRGPWRNRVYLRGVDPGDMVILAGMVSEGEPDH